jgi:secreted trypsin-like serine protease
MSLIFLFVCFVASFLASSVETKPGARIIGGLDSYAGQFPFAAAINVQTADSRFFCGGALLNHNWVITSGHCVNNATIFTIQLGSNTLTSTDPDREIFSTNDYVIHPDFVPDTIENDIGLIKLRLPVSFTSYIQPINLPTVSLLNETQVTALGWGQTSDSDSALSETLQYVSATILSNAACRLVYGNQITDNMACVEGNYNEGTCIGDTGSPLVEYLSRLYWIVGVSSFLSGNGCESTDPSGYTRIFPYTDWIRTIINP